MIADSYNRIHDYLRVAITDNCNFRCSYCMPQEDISFLPHNKLMSVDEIVAISTTFVKMGVKKIRLTGGEPLVRTDGAEIIKRLSTLPVELTLTSNGFLIDRFIDFFADSDIRSINISLDTLQPEKFLKLTRRDAFNKVWNNILLLLNKGIYVKLNVVAMKGINDDEINDFVSITKDLPLHVRFIEFMPFDGNYWNKDKVLPASDILQNVEESFSFIKIKDEINDTAKKFKPLNHEGTFAIITTMSQPFCNTCNRIRLTADGKVKNCLFSSGEVDLLKAFRNGDDITGMIQMHFAEKHKERGGQFPSNYEYTDTARINNRSMIKIGG